MAGARVDNLFFAAGLGDLAAVRGFFDQSGQLRSGALGSYSPPVPKRLGADRAAYIQEALHFAVTHGPSGDSRVAAQPGADVNGRTAGHHSELPLLQAAFVQEVPIARWLLARGADAELVCGKRRVSAREYVKRQGPDELGSFLLED